MRRPLLLNGPAGAGKSEVARLVAARTGARFVELNEGGGEGPGAHPTQSDRSQTAASVRLEALLDDGEPVVVSLGADSLLSRGRRLRALDSAVVVALRAPVGEVLQRRRGLLPGVELDPGVLESELELRAGAYAEAHATVDTGAGTVEEAADQVAEIWRRNAVAVAAAGRSYAVEIGNGVAPRRIQELLGAASKIVLVSDENVFGLHGGSMERALGGCGTGVCRIVLPPGEEHKSLASLERILVQALGAGADRSSVVVGFGGGVVTDVAGFAAATWMRGVRWVAVPTTLLAMVDASVGGKTAVDLLTAKNAVGAFWQPDAVVCDVAYLRTEPPRGYRSALAEVVKTALIGDPDLLELVETSAEAAAQGDLAVAEDMVRRSIRVKARVVSQDEREGGLRACLNLGHTLGHALESQGGYTQLSHGEAVSLGLVLALRLGERLGVTPAAITSRVTRLLARLGRPTETTPAALLDAAKLIGHDKKRSGSGLRFVLVENVGAVCTRRMELSELEAQVRVLAGG